MLESKSVFLGSFHSSSRVQGFFPRLLGRCWVEGYATGNFSAAQAAELAACVQSVLVRPSHATASGR